MRKLLYFLIAHLPFRLFLNGILYLAIFASVLHSFSFYIENNPESIKQYLKKNFAVELTFKEVSANYNLFNPSFTFKEIQYKHPQIQQTISIKSAYVSFELLNSLTFLKPYIKHLEISDIDIPYQILSPFISDQSQPIHSNNIALTKESIDIQSLLNSLPNWILEIKSLNLSNARLSFVNQRTQKIESNIDQINLYIKNTVWQHDLFFSANHQCLETSQQYKNSINNEIINDALPNKLSGRTLEKTPEKTHLSFIARANGSVEKRSNWTGNFNFKVDNIPYDHLEQVINDGIENWLFSTDYQITDGVAHLNSWGRFSNNSLNSLVGKVSIDHLKLVKFDTDLTLLIDNFKSNYALSTSTSILKSKRVQEDILSRLYLNLSNTQFTLNNSPKVQIPELSLQLQHNQNSTRIKLFSPHFNYEGLNDLTSFIFPEQEELIHALDIQTELKRFYLHANLQPNKKDRVKFYVQIHDYKQKLYQYFPKLKHLSGRLWLNNTDDIVASDNINAVMLVKSNDIEFYNPLLFRHHLFFKQLQSKITWQTLEQQKVLSFKDTSINNQNLTAWFDGSIWTDKQFTNPLFNINLEFEDVTVNSVPLYIPEGLLDKEIYDYLSGSLTKGIIPHAKLFLRGRFDKFASDEPFTHEKVSFIFDAKKAHLKPFNQWPMVESLNANFNFTEKGFSIHNAKGKIFSSYFNQGIISLSNYNDNTLSVRTAAQSNLKDIKHIHNKYKLLSPTYLDKLNQNISYSTIATDSQKQNIHLDLNLQIPIDDSVNFNTTSVKIESKAIKHKVKATINHLAYQPSWFKSSVIDDIKGEFSIENSQLRSLDLTGKINNEKINLVFNQPLPNTMPESKTNTLANKENSFSITTRVHSDLIKDINNFPSYLFPVIEQIKGNFPLHLNFSLLGSDKDNWQLLGNSNLDHLVSVLPPPLKKAPNTLKNLHFSLTKNNKIKKLLLKYDDKVNLCSIFSPTTETISHQIYMSQSNNKFLPDTCIQTQSDILFSGIWQMENLSSWQSLLGKIDFPYNPGQVTKIEFDIDKLYLPKQNLAKQSNKKSSTSVQNSNRQNTPSTPIIVNGKINSVFIDDESIGQFIFFSKAISPTEYSHNLNIKGDFISVNLKGLTLSFDQSSHTSIEARIEVPNFGHFLESLYDYKHLKKTPLEVNGSLAWKGNLWDIELNKLQGELAVQTQPGVFTKINPGAAKILSILNLNSIKQQLQKEYKDFSGDGFIFDSIIGNLRFKQGIIDTNKFFIASGIADIEVNGTLDYLKDQLDHTVTVTPKISSSLTYAGFLLAGPTGAAVGWLGKQVFGKQFNKITQYEYLMIGPLDSPIITDKIPD